MTVQFISGLFSFKQAIKYIKCVPGIMTEYNLAVQQVGSNRVSLQREVWLGRSSTGLLK